MKRILACADVHGHHHALQLLLKAAAYNPAEDGMVLIGDLIDRGPDSCAMVQFARELQNKGAHVLRGNHEQAIASYLGWYLSEEDYFNGFGGERTVMSYIEKYNKDAYQKMIEDAKWLTGLPLAFELKNYFFCHAGFDTTKSLDAQEEEFLWGTDNFLYKEPGIGKLVVFGHYQAKNLRGDGQWKPWMHRGKLCINTGADVGGMLSLVELPTGKVYTTQTVNSLLPVPDPGKVYPGKVMTYRLGE